MTTILLVVGLAIVAVAGELRAGTWGRVLARRVSVRVHPLLGRGVAAATPGGFCLVLAASWLQSRTVYGDVSVASRTLLIVCAGCAALTVPVLARPMRVPLLPMLGPGQFGGPPPEGAAQAERTWDRLFASIVLLTAVLAWWLLDMSAGMLAGAGAGLAATGWKHPRRPGSGDRRHASSAGGYGSPEGGDSQ